MGKLAEAFIEIGSKTDAFDKGLTASEQKLKDFVGRAQSLTAALGVGLGAAGTVRIFADMAEKGSDLIETMSKIQQVFGTAAPVVVGMANDLADRFGAVKGVTLDAAANLGLVAQGAGLTAQKSADLSIKLTKLADDASSFFNVPLDVALEKIRSGLVGEAEPLRAFGVLLSESAVKQQALAMGIKPVNGELTEQEKVLARVELITRGLIKAQGDHERTMDGYANQLKKVNGQLENFKANIGASMSGGLADVMKTVQDKGILAGVNRFINNALATPLQVGRKEGIFQEAADAAAGVVKGGIKGPPDAFTMSIVKDEEAWQEFKKTFTEAKDRRAFDAGKFGGGGFGAFGPMGNLADIMLAPEIDRRELDLRRKKNGWSGGWGAMGSTDFVRSAQESILKPKDEVAKKQLDELVKIRETLTKTKPPEVAGVVLRGRAN